MKNIEIIEKFEKLERSLRFYRWSGVAISFLIIGFGFFLISNPELGNRDKFIVGNVIVPIGAGILGSALGSWSGTPAHKLLREAISNLHLDRDQT
ncbi:hypothetical protein ACJJIU_03870 [Microbulbifer sp. CnH-101-E]|uniref:hypothetical protein n=1 Tax=unclassified Microbulbifer TaxID=2619833 RepID=UPI00403A3305